MDRDSIRSRLPANLDELARETGALLRRREVKSAEQVLWMSLIDSGAVGSVRAGDFDLQDTSVRYWQQSSVAFLCEVLNYLLFGGARAVAAEAIRRRVILLEATAVSVPGANGTSFRVQAEHVLGRGLAHVEISNDKGSERREYKSGDIVLADQGLATARSIHHVACCGADCVIRVYLPNLKLTDEEGKRLFIDKVLALADRGISSLNVLVPLEDYKPVRARLVSAKLPPEQAERARQRLRERAGTKQKVITELADRLAGYVIILTTLPKSELSEEEVLETYRLRWQIELFFKRSKSILGLKELAASTAKTAKAWLLGKMIIVVLIDRAITKLSQEVDVVSRSLWRLAQMCQIDLVAALTAVEEQRGLRKKATRRLKDTSGRRKTADSQIRELHGEFDPGLCVEEE